MLEKLLRQWEQQKRVCERGAVRHTDENAKVLLAQALVYDQCIHEVRKVLAP